MHKSIFNIIAAIAFVAQAAFGQVTTPAAFYTQVADYATATGDVEIVVGANLTLDQLVDIPMPTTEGITLTIRSVDPAAPVTLKRGKSGDLFTVLANAELTLEDIIIDGDSDGDFENGGGSLVRVNGSGSLVMDEGAVVRNNTKSGTGNINGGGVLVNPSGTFTMNGGEISGNTIINTSDNTAAIGGGVSVGGTFIMNDGKISGNTASGLDYNTRAGGVNVSGTFTMNGGEISGNIVSCLTPRGGGVFAFSGTFTMSGGKISGNTNEGVYVWNGTFAMSGGEISNNTRGVYFFSGTFTMSGGEISNNTATNGGGVFLSGLGTFTMDGGVVVGLGNNITSNVIYDGSGGSYNLNNDAIAITWDKRGTGPFVYTEGTSTNLIVKPAEGATAVWATKNGKLGISYKNGDNEGFVEIADATVKTAAELETDCLADGKVWEDGTCKAKTDPTPDPDPDPDPDPSPIRLTQISAGSISVYTTGKSIVLQNLPTNTKVEVYNLQGKRIYFANPENPKILAIGVQTKGVYVVKAGSQTLRVVVK